MMSMILPLLRLEEGERFEVYVCSNGYATFGVGTKVANRPIADGESESDYLAPYVWLNEYGRPEVSASLLNVKIDAIVNQLSGVSWFAELNQPRRDVIVSMAYQMGVSGLLAFKNMIQGLIDHDWQKAHNEALDSSWAKHDSPNRARRHAIILLTGDWQSVDEYRGY